MIKYNTLMEMKYKQLKNANDSNINFTLQYINDRKLRPTKSTTFSPKIVTYPDFKILYKLFKLHSFQSEEFHNLTLTFQFNHIDKNTSD